MLVSPMLAWTLAALAATGLLRMMLARLGLYRFVWHKPLFDLALLVIVLGGVVSATKW